LQIKPKNGEICNNLGVVYFKQKQYDKALDQFQTAIRLKPDFADAYYNLAIVYTQKEMPKEAIEADERYQKLQEK
jgi:tetratricopeptide (TPR) repeat protein